MRPVDLSGRVAIVTGASRGIGFAVAARLLEAGASVIVNARAIEEGALEQLRSCGSGLVDVVVGPIENAETSKQLARTAFSKHKRLDILVNNAGVMRPSMIGMISEADIDATLQINLASVIRLTQDAARLMSRSGGSIINISSIVGVRGTAGQLAYAASKAGVIGATLSAAKELGRKNIRVNAIAPGFVTTKMTADLGAAVEAETVGQIGLGRAGSPEDVADVALFLASDLSRYVTGQVIGVDGGMIQ